MRHGKRFNHLGRTAPHRKATLSNLASSLLMHKRINTTLAKAKALRKYVEPLITKAKDDTTHSRRVVFSYLQDKESVTALYNEVVDRIGDRPGGYTRIIKLGSRLGDNAEMAMIELVDFNDFLIEETTTQKPKTRRSRRGKGKGKDETPETAVSAEDTVEEKASEKKSKTEDKKSENIAEEKPVEEKKEKEPEAKMEKESEKKMEKEPEEKKEGEPEDKKEKEEEEIKAESKEKPGHQKTSGEEKNTKTDESQDKEDKK